MTHQPLSLVATCVSAPPANFEKRILRRFVGVRSIWAEMFPALTIRITLCVTLTSLAVLLFICAVNIGAGGGVAAYLPIAVWLCVAIEETPLDAAQSTHPARDVPRGTVLAIEAPILPAMLITAINPAVTGVSAHALSTLGKPVPDGFHATSQHDERRIRQSGVFSEPKKT